MRRFDFLMLIAYAVNLHAQLWTGLRGRLGTFGSAEDPYHEIYNRALTGGGCIALLHKTGLGVEWAIDYYSQESNTEPIKKLSMLPLTFSATLFLLQTEPIVPYAGLGIGDYSIIEDGDSKSETGFHGMAGLNFFFRGAERLVFEVRKNWVEFKDGDIGSWKATLGLTLTLFPQKPRPPVAHPPRPPKPHPRAVWVPGHWK